MEEGRALPVPPLYPQSRAAHGLRFRLALGLSDFRRRRAFGRADDVLPQLTDAGLLADLPAEVVQLRAIDVADRGDLDLLDLRRVERKGALDADAERLLADRERLPGAGALALDHDALEDLDALPLTLDHLEMDTDGIPRLELRDVLAQLGALECFDHLAHRKRARRPGRNPSERTT